MHVFPVTGSLSSAQAEESETKDIAVVSIKRFNMLAPPKFISIRPVMRRRSGLRSRAD